MNEPPERWIEISVEADPQSVDDLVGLFEKHCAGGAVVEQAHLGRLGSPSDRLCVKGFLDQDDAEKRQKLEIALLLLSRVSPISEPQVRVLRKRDWADAWKAYYAPQRVAERLVVVPSWQEYQAAERDLVLRLDPGMAFGTGLHASTRLAAQGLEQVIEPGWKVLDVGTGSGILAIAAILYGAGAVDAIDIAAEAVRATRENATKNGMADRIQVAQATLAGSGRADQIVEWSRTGYDLLLMNILAEPIMQMSEAACGALREGGWLVASGIIAESADAVQAKLEVVGLCYMKRLEEAGWVGLLARKE